MTTVKSEKPIIGRYSNEQLRFTRNSGLKSSDFYEDAPKASRKDLLFSMVLLTMIAISVGLLYR